MPSSNDSCVQVSVRTAFAPSTSLRIAASFLTTAALSLPGVPRIAAHAGVDETFKLTVDYEGETVDLLGGAVDIDGTTAIVGATWDDDNGLHAGATYLFDTSTGNQIAKLTPNEAASGDIFGFSVGVSGTTVIVGSPGDDDNGPNSGSAYLFDTITGSQIAKLTPDDGGASDRFGGSVGVSDTTAVVGIPRLNEFFFSGTGTSVGSAYIFDTQTGLQIAKLTPNDDGPVHLFGTAVGVSNSAVIVGAPGDDVFGANAGAAYLFDTLTGNHIAKLTPNDGGVGENFGVSVAISGDIAIVGMVDDNNNGLALGGAYLFDALSGKQIAKLIPDDPASGDYFGTAVAIDGTTAIVGAHEDDDNGSSSGSAYLCDTRTGNQIAKIIPAEGATGVGFGWTVGISGSTAIAGTDRVFGNRLGSAYLFGTDALSADPTSGGTFEFTVDENVATTLDSVIALTNTGDAGTVINVLGFSITGDDAALFEVPDFTTTTLTAGDPAFQSATFDLTFLGASLGSYDATLTLQTDSGDVAYNLLATVPEPTTGVTTILLASFGLCRRRRDG